MLFIVGMLCFAGGVKADIPPYSELYFSKQMVSVGEQVYYNFNDFMNDTGVYTIEYDDNYLKYYEFFCYVDDNNEGMTPCETTCEVDYKKKNQLVFSCDGPLKDDEFLGLTFDAIKSTNGEDTVISEKSSMTEIMFEIIDDIDNNVSAENNINLISKCDSDEKSNFELLTEPFVIVIIAGFSIVVVILSVMLNKKTRQSKNVQN